jgi:hypothetical protein
METGSEADVADTRDGRDERRTSLHVSEVSSNDRERLPARPQQARTYPAHHPHLTSGFQPPQNRPRRQQDWILKCLQGGRAHPLAACGHPTGVLTEPLGGDPAGLRHNQRRRHRPRRTRHGA